VRKIAFILAIISVFMMLTIAVEAAIELPLRVEVNGERLNFPDEQPFIDSNGRTQVPARFIAEKLGANVTWNGKEQKAVFEKGSKKLVLYVGKAEYELNGEKKKMDTAALLISGRTFVPARYVAEAFDAVVSWDPDIRTVYINTNAKPSGKKEGTEIIAGFVVPLDTNLTAIEEDWGGWTEACFEVNLLRADVEGQIEDLRQILLQKCDSSTVDEVIAYVSQKKQRTYHLPEKYIYDKKSGRYIWIKESFLEDINVFYCSDSAKLKE